MASCLETFIRIFRTDALLSSWLLVVGTSIYVGVLAYILYAYEAYSTNDFDISATYLLFIGGVSYFIGSVVFAAASWDYSKTRQQMIEAKVKKWSLMKRYFNGNPLLVATWWFLFPSFLYLVIPSWAFIAGYITSTQAALSLSLLLLIIALQFVWVYSTFPANIQANNNQGSSTVFDTFCCVKDSSNSFWCFGFEITTEARSDFVIGAWVYTILAGALVVVCTTSLSNHPGSQIRWLFLFAIVFLFSGLFIKATTSASPELDTSYYFDTTTCTQVVYVQDAEDF